MSVLDVSPLSLPWQTSDPFLFCMHHRDAYPAGNAQMAPVASLAGRDIGQDFAGKDGWNMYHGDVVPGFPQHPHRGFETVTIVTQGLIDHSDSLGATARFGRGDTQWVTAGAGIVHSEMFPLVNQNAGNPLELFQIWLNLPRANKHVKPHFSMLWNQTIPRVSAQDKKNRRTDVRVIAGTLGETKAPPPPPESWAAQDKSAVAIWTIAMEPGAEWVLPAAEDGVVRSLYFYEGDNLRIAEQNLERGMRIELSEAEILVKNGDAPAALLLLGGLPINEPVTQYGPFVMNTQEEIQQAFSDYRKTQFGGWPWPSDGPVHPRERGRFARYADGRVEEPPK